MASGQLSSVATTTALCEATLSVGAVLSFGPGVPITTLTHAAVLATPCAEGQTPTSPPFVIPTPTSTSGSDSDGSTSPRELFRTTQVKCSKFSEFRDAFFESLYPVFYVLAATTVTAYMLVIMLFVTPRSFLDGGLVYLGRSGFTGSASGGGGIQIGGRPWLQKVAAMTVAISLTIATAESFDVAEHQYDLGIHNAKCLKAAVMDSTALKIMRLVSDTFLWLAQAQTLIRLFPRQREKAIIKWTAFALITLQVIFAALNSFYMPSDSNGNSRPPNFNQAIPNMSYFFHLSLGFLYAAWVIYYALMKMRYAFYHPLMKNMALVSLLSLVAILLPVIFFIIDISQPRFIGWGDYVRWVGAAAASVVVWEWVERIEALEREEKKDGILGREVFDGDDMMEASSTEFPWLRKRKNRKSGFGGGGPGEGGGPPPGAGGGMANEGRSSRLRVWPGLTSVPPKYQGAPPPDETNNGTRPTATQNSGFRPPLWPARPPPAATPVSRTETASAASTDYAIRYQNMSETTGRTPDVIREHAATVSSHPRSPAADRDDAPSVAAPVPRQNLNATETIDPEARGQDGQMDQTRRRTLTWAVNPLRRGNNDAPATVAPHVPGRQEKAAAPARDVYEGRSRWDFRARLEDYAVTQAEKIRDRMQSTPETDKLPVMVIPAPPRQGAALAQVLRDEEAAVGSATQRVDTREPLERSLSEGSAFASFPGLGRTSTEPSQQASGSQGSDGTQSMHPEQPPLWPGVRHRHDHDNASEAPPPTSRRATDY
ncbi:PalH/RIM21-domain-containing protein [Plectosphaerella plurivora]|uniref:PalH/RIM21-domain-containing protein n=1 Tax=Plectosphaerella plurivora TaxID=936078 RepID=A0A9P9AC22_9PEZI|nr:PalH/RIM21-domain-containing protein [Plectosphaerella plurivora]